MAEAALLTFKDVTGMYTDANDIDENSICRYHSVYQPLANISGNIGAILTIKGYDLRYGYQLQFITINNGMYLYCRCKYDSQWKDWVKII